MPFSFIGEMGFKYIVTTRSLDSEAEGIPYFESPPLHTVRPSTLGSCRCHITLIHSYHDTQVRDYYDRSE